MPTLLDQWEAMAPCDAYEVPHPTENFLTEKFQVEVRVRVRVRCRV
jgi:hypothetical protein